MCRSTLSSGKGMYLQRPEVDAIVPGTRAIVLQDLKTD